MSGSVFILDSGCLSWAGHRCNGIKALRDAFMDRGFKIYSAVNKAAQNDVCQCLDADPIFPVAPWPAKYRNTETASLKNMLNYVAESQMAVGRFLSPLEENDIIILPTATAADILNLYSVLLANSFQKKIKIFVSLIGAYVAWDTEKEEYNEEAVLLKAALELLASLDGLEIKLMALTPMMVSVLEKYLAMPVALTSNPNDLSQFRNVRKDNTSQDHRAVKVLAPGHPKGTRGSDLIPPVIEHADAQRFRFFVQNWRPEKAPPPNTTLIENGLSIDQYTAFIKSGDIVLFLYDQKTYQYRISAVFEEAVAAGCVCIVTPDTWMADHIQKKNASGVVLADLSVEAISSALTYVADNLTPLAVEAEKKAKIWIQNLGLNGYMRVVGF